MKTIKRIAKEILLWFPIVVVVEVMFRYKGYENIIHNWKAAVLYILLVIFITVREVMRKKWGMDK